MMLPSEMKLQHDFYKRTDNRKFSGNQYDNRLSDYGGNFYLRREPPHSDRFNLRKGVASDDNFRLRREPVRAEGSRPLRYRSAESLDASADRRLFNWAPIPRIGNRVSVFDHYSATHGQAPYPVGCYVYQPEDAMEIPAELAFIFSKMDGWMSVHTEKDIRSVDDVAARNRVFTLPSDINAYTLSKYANSYCKDILTVRHNSPIRRPLLPKSNDQEVRTSLSIYKLILRHLTESSVTRDQDLMIARYIVQKGLEHVYLRDEIFLQICSQTLENKNVSHLRKTWVLMALCLSCFRPSETLANYLLKYVSDNAYDGYSALCQHKMLESEMVEGKVCRVYPPSILELAATEERKRMALHAIFSDGCRMHGEVDSWTTGEEFAANLLERRNVSDQDSHGWTVLLREGPDRYECAGYDFVLDLISEMEIPPGFPFGRSHHLVFSDKMRTGRRNHVKDIAHDPDRPRVMTMAVSELSEPMHTSSPDAFMQDTTSPSNSRSYVTYSDFASPNNALNRRVGVNTQNGPSATSVMNVRYISRTGYDVDADTPLTALDTHLFVQRRDGAEARRSEPIDVQQRHYAVQAPQSRFIRNSGIGPSQSSPQNHNSKEVMERQRKGGQRSDVADNQISDMDRWLESVFEQALDGTADDLEDDSLLTNRIRGGVKDEENEDLQTQNISLQTQLETQQLQNKVLQDNLQTELRKHQSNHPTSDADRSSPSSSANNPLMWNGNNTRVASPLPATEAGIDESASRPDHQYSAIWPNIPEPADTGSRFVTDSEIGHDGGRVRFQTKTFEHSDQLPLRSQVSSDSTSTQSPNYTSMLPASSSPTAPYIPIPPPPPPLPPSIRNLKPGIHPVTIRDRRGVERPVRVGKIQWPPPQEEVKKQEIEVGRLLIEEKMDDPNIPKRSTEEIRQRISERILAAQQMAAQQTAAQQPPKTTTKPFVVNKEFPKKPPVPLPDHAKPPVVSKAVENANRIAVDVKRRQEELRLQFDNTPRQPLLLPVPTTMDEAVQTNTPTPTQRAMEGVAVQTASLTPSVIVKPQPTVHIPVDTVDAGRVKETRKAFDVRSPDPDQTVLHPRSTGSFLTYNTDSWTVCVRKEVFTPMERQPLHPLLINLIFRQIADDVYSDACIRISKVDKAAMRAVLDEFERNTSRFPNNKENDSGKVSVIETAKNWPVYFSRIFAVSGGTRLPSVQLLGVSHSAVRLLSRQKTSADDVLGVVETIRFEDIADVSVPKKQTLQIHYANKYVFLYTFRANQIKRLIDAFCAEAEREMPSHVKAVRDHLTRIPGQLNFKKGDIIQVTKTGSTTERVGWLQGMAHGRSGSFPADHVIPVQGRLRSVEYGVRSLDQSSGTDGRQDTLKRSFADATNKYCMLDFAMLYFREAPYRYEMSQSEDLSRPGNHQKMHINNGRQEEWTWREQVNMIKWTQNPLDASLLKFDSPTLNQEALNCFINIMRYMNDCPLTKGMEQTDCSLFLLTTCQTHPELADEIICQLMKQITNNRSNKPESCLLGWRLLSLFLSYYRCSDHLLPHLRKYLEQNANNTQLPHRAVAGQCLENLQQTMKYGGRKCMPSKSELSAVMCGRLANQLLCMLPGGVPAKITVKSSTVILDAVKQVCDTLQLKNSMEMLEFTMYGIIGPDDYAQLQEKAYLMDVMTNLRNQNKDFFFLCQRTSWIFPLHLDGNLSYINLMYQQNRPDYLDGYLLAIPSKTLPTHAKEDIALLAALQIQAADIQTIPQKKDMEIFIPLNAQRVSNISLSQWTNLVHEYLKNVRQLTPHECQIKYLEILSRWPKFGSTFFPVKSVSDDSKRGGSCLLGVNSQGLHFCSTKTNETLMFFPYGELLSARQRMQRSGTKFLDIKCGSLMQHKVLALQTDKAEDLGLLIDQYIRIHQAIKEKRISL